MIVLLCLESPRLGRAGRAALELACSLGDDVRAIALTAGGPPDSGTLALARSWAGISQVVHLADGALDNPDFMTMGMVLAAAARHLEAGLVLTGERSDEEGQGLVPAALAHHLHAPLLARTLAVRPSGRADRVEVLVRAGGQIVTLLSPQPTVVSVPARPVAQASAGPASLRDVETWGLDRIGLDAGRLVPRPELLGTLVPRPAETPREMSFEDAAAALLRHR